MHTYIYIYTYIHTYRGFYRTVSCNHVDRCCRSTMGEMPWIAVVAATYDLKVEVKGSTTQDGLGFRVLKTQNPKNEALGLKNPQSFGYLEP